MWGLLDACRTRYAETFMCAQSTWQGQTACQISPRNRRHLPPPPISLQVETSR